MKFLIILIVATSFVRGYRYGRYHESEYRTPQRNPRYGSSYVEHNRNYRDSFRQSPQPYLEEPNYRDQPPPYRDEKYFSELGSYSDQDSFYPERPPFFKKPTTSFKDYDMPYGNQQEMNYNAFPPQPFNDVTSSGPSQPLKTDPLRQSLSFGGHSNYLKFGNHALGFASVPIKSPLSDNVEFPSASPSPTEAAITTTISTLDAHANDQNNTSKVPQSTAEIDKPIMKSNTLNDDSAKFKIETSVTPMMSVETSKPLIMSPNEAEETKPLSQMQSSTMPIGMIPPEMKRMPFGISLPLTALRHNSYMRGGTDLRYNNLPEESKGYQSFDFQQSTPPEVLGYMLPPQQINSPVKFNLPSLPSLPISSLSSFKYLQPNVPKFTFINHETINPQTSLSLASAFPVSDFGQNTVQLGQFGHLDSHKQDVLPGLQLDLDGFSGIGGINYGSQTSNSILKPAVLGIAKLGLSLPEASHSIIPSFTKIGLGQQLW